MTRTGASRDHPTPRLVLWQAPSHWRHIDFISDLHLSESMPRTTAACAEYLLSTPADGVVILGDLFELWVGDDMGARPFEAMWLHTMQRVAARTSLRVMVGNRDFLLGPAAMGAAGTQPLPDPTALEAWGRRWLLTHGDALCLADTAYQSFRQLVRGAEWQASFLARPLTERLAIAADIRRHSEDRRRFDGDALSDIDPAEARRWLDAAGTTELIHGHTHRPGGPDEFAPGLVRHVLSDWDLDDPRCPRAEVLRLSREGLARLTLAQAARPV